MPFRGRLTNVRNAFRDLEEDLMVEVATDLEEQSEEFLDAVREATPVDTGNARDSWFLTPPRRSVIGQESETVAFNTTDYIDELNNGSSRQAPARFIESTALRFFEPTGVIVRRSTRRP